MVSEPIIDRPRLAWQADTVEGKIGVKNRQFCEGPVGGPSGSVFGANGISEIACSEGFW